MELRGLGQPGTPGQGGSGQGEAGQGRPEAVVELTAEPAALLLPCRDQPSPRLQQVGEGAVTVQRRSRIADKRGEDPAVAPVKPDSPRRGDSWSTASSSPR